MRGLVIVTLRAGAGCAHASPPVAEPVGDLSIPTVSLTRRPSPLRDTTRYVPSERASVSPPPVDALLATPPCPEPVPAPEANPWLPSTRYNFSDESVQRAFEAEQSALADPPALRCHFYAGGEASRAEYQAHLRVRAGEYTEAPRGGMLFAVSFVVDLYEGSSLHVSAERDGAQLLRASYPIALQQPPATRDCGGPGFTGWIAGSDAADPAQLRVFCESERAGPP
jgi:hypothetical protein